MYVRSAPLQRSRQPPGMTLLLPVVTYADELLGNAHCQPNIHCKSLQLKQKPLIMTL